MKKTPIVILAAIIIAVIIGGIFFVFFSPKSNVTNKTAPAPDHYNVEKGLEKVAITVKPAVESYASQNSSEPATSRNDRLKRYFASDSPVYNYPQANITPLIKSSTAVVTSITSIAEDSGSNISQTKVNAFAKITFVSVNNKSSIAYQKYWVSYNKSTTDSVVAYDIGEY